MILHPTEDGEVKGRKRVFWPLGRVVMPGEGWCCFSEEEKPMREVWSFCWKWRVSWVVRLWRRVWIAESGRMSILFLSVGCRVERFRW